MLIIRVYLNHDKRRTLVLPPNITYHANPFDYSLLAAFLSKNETLTRFSAESFEYV